MIWRREVEGEAETQAERLRAEALKEAFVVEDAEGAGCKNSDVRLSLYTHSRRTRPRSFDPEVELLHDLVCPRPARCRPDRPRRRLACLCFGGAVGGYACALATQEARLDEARAAFDLSSSLYLDMLIQPDEAHEEDAVEEQVGLLILELAERGRNEMVPVVRTFGQSALPW